MKSSVRVLTAAAVCQFVLLLSHAQSPVPIGAENATITPGEGADTNAPSVEIRDRDMQEFARGRGSAELFQKIQDINRALNDEDTTYLLFKAIREGDPKLAQECFSFVESQLIEKGQYEWCNEYFGDPQFRFSLARQSFDMQMAMQKRIAESNKRTMELRAKFNQEHGMANSAPFTAPDPSAIMLQNATNSFVGSVSGLIEVLVGTGHREDAGKIRDEALLVLDDARLKSALSDAQERVEKRSAFAASDSSTLTNFTVLPLAKSETGFSADSNASAEKWSPTLQPGEKPDFIQILQDAKELMSKHEYEEALQREIWYHNHSKSDPSQRGVRNSSALADWAELARQYPKAKQALMDIRAADEHEFSAGHGSVGLFLEYQSINDEIGDDDATYSLFKKLDRENKQLAKKCFSIAEPLLVQKKEYDLCMDYIGNPDSAFERIRSSREKLKAWEDKQEKQREQQREHFQAMAKTNPAFARLPSFPGPPKLADMHFTGDTRQLTEILDGANRKSDAEKIRAEASAVLNADRIASSRRLKWIIAITTLAIITIITMASIRLRRTVLKY